MSENAEKYEDSVLCDRYYFSQDCECNSSSGGSVYQEMHGRLEEIATFSTDDEFMDATETIRTPLFSEDTDHQSSPILKQLNEEKELSRYILVDMPSTETDSTNNSSEKCQESSINGSMETSDETTQLIDEMVNGTDMEENKLNPVPSATYNRSEKMKSARTLRLPSAVSLSTVKPDRPARGDGRGPISNSRIPIPRASGTKIKQPASTEERLAFSEVSQNESERLGLASCHPPSASFNEEKIVDETVPHTIEVNSCQIITGKPPIPPSTPRPTTSSSKKEGNQEEGAEKIVSNNETNKSEELNPIINQETIINNTEGTLNFLEDFNSTLKEATIIPSPNTEVDNQFQISISMEPLINEKGRSKRGRSNSKIEDKNTEEPTATLTGEEGDTKRMRVGGKHFSKTTDISKDGEKRRREIQAVRQRIAKDKLILYNSKIKDENKIQQVPQIQMVVEGTIEGQTAKESSKDGDNSILETEIKLQTTPCNRTSERNSQKTTSSPSPRQTSPTVTGMSIAERRRQMRRSREGATGEPGTEVGNKDTNMPDIKPLLIKQQPLKAGQMATISITEKRRQMMKQREASNSKSGTNDAVLANKRFERESREKPANQKPATGNKKSKSNIQKPSSGNQQLSEKSHNQNSNTITLEIQAKPVSATTRVTLNSLQNVYKTNYKRYEEHVNEMDKARERATISRSKLEELRKQIIHHSGEDPGEIMPPCAIRQSVVLAAPTAITKTQGMNTEALEEDITESLILLGNNQQLKSEIDKLRRELEEAKCDVVSKQKEAKVVPDLKQRITEMSLSLKLAEKRYQTLEEKMKKLQAIIDSLNEDNQQIAELKKILKQRDTQLMALKKQNDDKSKELESAQKKVEELNASHDSAMQEEANKRNMLHDELKSIQEERSSLEKQLHEVTIRFQDFEEREECLHTRLENEKKKVLMLEEELNKRATELCAMEEKMINLEISSSNSLVSFSEQLTAKDAVVHELEILRANVQSQNREMCCLISDVFALKGKNYNADKIQAAVSTGRLPILREELLKTFEERIEGNNKALDDARSKIAELQNQVKIMQIELEDSKMISERLTNVISQQRPWESEKTWDDKCRPWSSDKFNQIRNIGHSSLAEIPMRETMTHRDGEINSVVSSINNSYVCSDAAVARNNFNELFILLEGKRRALVQMERKLHDMEEVHSHCAQKRTRNETRIAQLEMMLA